MSADNTPPSLPPETDLPADPSPAAVKPKSPRAPRRNRAAEERRAAEAAALARARSMRPVLTVAALIVALDQALKYVVVHIMRLDQLREIDLIDPWLNLRMAWNQGVNFGLFSSDVDMMRWVLIGVAAVICIWVWIWLVRTRHSRFAKICAGLLIGGAIGNVIDRMTYGAVADFLNMSLPNWRNPYSFNVADISIFAGAIGLFLQPPANRDDDGAAKPKAKRAEPRPRDKTRDATGK